MAVACASVLYLKADGQVGGTRVLAVGYSVEARGKGFARARAHTDAATCIAPYRADARHRLVLSPAQPGAVPELLKISPSSSGTGLFGWALPSGDALRVTHRWPLGTLADCRFGPPGGGGFTLLFAGGKDASFRPHRGEGDGPWRAVLAAAARAACASGARLPPDTLSALLSGAPPPPPPPPRASASPSPRGAVGWGRSVSESDGWEAAPRELYFPASAAPGGTNGAPRGSDAEFGGLPPEMLAEHHAAMAQLGLGGSGGGGGAPGSTRQPLHAAQQQEMARMAAMQQLHTSQAGAAARGAGGGGGGQQARPYAPAYPSPPQHAPPMPPSPGSVWGTPAPGRSSSFGPSSFSPPQAPPSSHAYATPPPSRPPVPSPLSPPLSSASRVSAASPPPPPPRASQPPPSPRIDADGLLTRLLADASELRALAEAGEAADDAAGDGGEAGATTEEEGERAEALATSVAAGASQLRALIAGHLGTSHWSGRASLLAPTHVSSTAAVWISVHADLSAHPFSLPLRHSLY